MSRRRAFCKRQIRINFLYLATQDIVCERAGCAVHRPIYQSISVFISMHQNYFNNFISYDLSCITMQKVHFDFILLMELLLLLPTTFFGLVDVIIPKRIKIAVTCYTNAM